MKPYACVIGDLSLIRALGRARIPVVLVTSNASVSAARSRYCHGVLETPSWIESPEAAVETLAAFGATQAWPPVLFPQGDHDLLAISRHRAALSRHFKVALPSAELVEDMVDKRRFAALAARRGLPVPRTLVVDAAQLASGALERWDSYPCILKPSMRTHWFESRLQAHGGHGTQKALHVTSRDELLALRDDMAEYGGDFLLQELIPGGEEHVVSYHAYVRADGRTVADFSGRKVRTAPRRYGLSSCVLITDEPEVRHLGRAILAQLGFTGVVKLDFKEHEETGRLYLLEANPRFNLWHHPGAIAGVNIPALVYQDLTTGTLPAEAPRARPGVRWLSARDDFAAFGEYHAAGELSLGRWLYEVAAADVREDLSLSDPVPTLRDGFYTLVNHGIRLLERRHHKGDAAAAP